MANTTYFEMKTGQTSAVLDVVLSDSRGPVDLTGFAWVKLTVRRRPAAAVINAVAMTADADQIDNPGRVTFAFTGSYADIVPGEYDIEINGQDAGGLLHPFPVSESEPFGKLIVLPTLT